jgi:hypothetical protein
MKTNQTMLVTIGNYTQEIEHLTYMGKLNTLWAYGNSLRVAKGKDPLLLENWVRMPDVVEFAIELQKSVDNDELVLKNAHVDNIDNSNSVDPTDLKNSDINQSELETPEISVTNGFAKMPDNLTVFTTKKGRYGGTWCHLYMLLKAAAHLDKAFEVQVYNEFVKGKILEWRDRSGDSFKELNKVLDTKFNIGDDYMIYVNIAKDVALHVLGSSEKGQWNTASKEQLEHRTRVLSNLSVIVSLGFLKTIGDVQATIFTIK